MIAESTESALPDVEVPLAQLFDLAPSFLAVLRGPEHTYIRVNDAYRDLVGDRPLVGLPVREALPEVSAQGLLEILDSVYRTGEPYVASEQTVRLRRRRGGEEDERVLNFVYQPLTGPGGEVEGIAAHGVDVTEQVRAREAVEQRERRWRELIRNSHDKITVLSENGTVLFESPAGERLLGWKEEELVGRDVLDFVYPEDRELARQHHRAAIATPGAPQRFLLRLLHKDGSWRNFEVVGQARQTEAGLEVVTNSRDVTDRRNQEAELHTLVELMPQLVWATTPDGYHDFFNQRWYDYTGMERAGDQGWNWKDYLHPDDYERTLEVWHHSLATGEPYEIEYRFRRASDGEYRWFIGRAHPLRGPDGGIVRWFGTCTDVHDERMALEAAEASQERFRAATSATNDVVWDWDLTTDSVWRNTNVEKVLRLDRDELGEEMDSWARRIHPDDRDRVLAGLKAALEDGGDVWSAEYRFVRGDGSIGHFLDRGRMIRDGTGEPVRMIGSITDLTERARLEEELRQAQKMEAIGRLAGGIAHDFNNLLTVISNFSEMLIEDLGQDDNARDDILEIRKAADRAASLTRQLLAFGRRQVLQPRDLNLNDVAADIQKMLRRVLGEHIELEFEHEHDLATVHADPGQMEQVIVNLALNARDAMPGGGTLTLTTANVTVGSARGRDAGVRAGPYVQLTIRDTGVGMDEETRLQALEPFFTTKAEGTGLGLATVHGIVTQSGGFLELESEPGVGTVLRIYLPVEERGSPQPLLKEPTQSPVAEGSGTVLLVEDEEAVRVVAKRGLVRNGYTVHEATNGQEALAWLSEVGGGVDLIITDLVMPVMGGSELAALVRDLPGAPPILFMSGYADAEMRPQSSGEEMPRFLEKPFTINQLLSAVAAAL